MEAFTVNAEKRTVTGKKTRFLRRHGLTPAHLIGHKLDSLALQCGTEELEKIIKRAGTSRIINLQVGKEKGSKKVIIKEIQRDPIKRDLQHVDFYLIKMKEKMKTEIPVIIIGEAPALKTKGYILNQLLTNVMVESLPDKLPPSITVDISSLENLQDAIYIKEINVDKDVAILSDPDNIIVKISEVAVAKITEEVPVAEEGEAEAPEEEREAAAEGKTEAETDKEKD